MDHLMAGIEDIVGKTGNYNVRDKFKRFDNKFIRPLLIRDLKVGFFLEIFSVELFLGRIWVFESGLLQFCGVLYLELQVDHVTDSSLYLSFLSILRGNRGDDIYGHVLLTTE